MRHFTIAIDVMGGDNAPGSIIAGVARAIANKEQANYLLFGDSQIINSLLKKHQLSDCKQVSLVNTTQVITGEMKASDAVRNSKNSSMRLAIEAVKNNQADGVISAGNTGAYTALAKMILKSIDGIDRPAIIARMPTARHKPVAMLDLGANVECSQNNLLQFAIMGQAFARCLQGTIKPSIGLLNIGAEDLKGSEVVRQASKLIRDSKIIDNFHGFVEGNDILAGTTDVVVTDGFSGNIALKATEGTAKFILANLKQALTGSWLAKIGALFAAPSLKRMRRKLDARRYNGAVFLGLNGVAVKSHGNTDAIGFACAISITLTMTKSNINSKISSQL